MAASYEVLEEFPDEKIGLKEVLAAVSCQLSYNVFFVDQMARAYLLLCKLHELAEIDLRDLPDTSIFNLSLTYDLEMQ